MASKPSEKDASYLMTIMWKQGKHLLDYFACFNKAMLETSLLEKGVVIKAAK